MAETGGFRRTLAPANAAHRAGQWAGQPALPDSNMGTIMATEVLSQRKILAEKKKAECERRRRDLHDGGGLHIQFSGTGSASWLFRYRFGGRRREMGLGSFSAVGLAQAREKAREQRAILGAGRDPCDERKAKIKPLPFENVAKLCLADASDPRAEWWGRLERHVFPAIGKMLVDQISGEHVFKVLKPIWETKTDTARKVRQHIETILSYATVKTMRTGENPATLDVLKAFGLKSPGEVRSRKHLTAMKKEDAPAFMAELAAFAGLDARALEFLILTNARSGSITGAKAKLARQDATKERPAVPPLRWDDIDLGKRVWAIPKTKMDKAVRDENDRFRVPLSDRAVALLEDVRALELAGPRVFPIGKNAMRDVLRKRLKLDCDPHGFRTTFKTWAMRSGRFERHVIETAMAHKVEVEGGEVERSYIDTTFLAERRELMAAWANYLSGTAANVVPLKRPEVPAEPSALEVEPSNDDRTQAMEA